MKFSRFLRFAQFPDEIIQNFKLNYPNQAMKKVIENKDKLVGHWLVFYGPPGTGKTYASAVASFLFYKRGIIQNASSVLFISASDILPEDRDLPRELVSKYELVVIDDLFTEFRDSTPIIENIIFKFYEKGKFLFFTTNFAHQVREIRTLRTKYENQMDKRAVSRLFQKARFIYSGELARRMEADLM